MHLQYYSYNSSTYYYSYKSSTYSTPLINLSSIELTSDEINQFKLRLHYSFVDKNKNIKMHLAANL